MTSKFKLSASEYQAILLEERISALEVAEKIRLPSKSNVHDHIDLSLTPYSRLPIFFIGKSEILLILIIAPTQSGKTVTLQVAVADMISQAPATGMYCLPDEKSGKKALEEKIIGMIKASTFLAQYIKYPTNRFLTSQGIKLKNMTLLSAWSNSPASMNSIPCARIFMDEIRLFKLQLGDESNAVKLLMDRLTTYMSTGQAQAYGVSTPSIEGDLLHQQTTIKGTHILWYYWKCPTCGSMFIPDFFRDLLPFEDAVCRCPYCTSTLSDKNQKRDLLKGAMYGYFGQDGEKVVYLHPDYKVTEEDLLSHRVSKIPIKDRVVCRYCSLSSPFRTFEKILNEYYQTKDNINDYKNFIQCWLARFWEKTESKLTTENLRERIDPKQQQSVVPDDCRVLVAGVDTQDDGFFVTVRAFGTDMETWLIDCFFIPCMMATATSEQLGALFKSRIEDKKYRSDTGVIWQVSSWAIDTGGHRTHEVYDATSYCTRILWIKGRNTQAETIMSVSKSGLYLVRTDDYAEQTEVLCTQSKWHLFASVPEEYLEQFLNYAKVFDYDKRTKKKRIFWKKLGKNDYRMADIHCFIAMDISTSNGMSFRQCTSLEDWVMNPYIVVKKHREKKEVSNNVKYLPKSTTTSLGMGFGSGSDDDWF